MMSGYSGEHLSCGDILFWLKWANLFSSLWFSEARSPLMLKCVTCHISGQYVTEDAKAVAQSGAHATRESSVVLLRGLHGLQWKCLSCCPALTGLEKSCWIFSLVLSLGLGRNTDTQKLPSSKFEASWEMRSAVFNFLVVYRPLWAQANTQRAMHWTLTQQPLIGRMW